MYLKNEKTVDVQDSKCNEKKNLLLLNKGDKLVSPHKAEPDCRINQHLNANMAFGNTIFMAGLHH